MPIAPDQIQAPFVIAWPESAASAEYDGGPTKHILVTAVTPGTAGNNIDVDATSDVIENGTLAIDVQGTNIHISLATSDSWTSISTAQEVIDLINNDPAASALVVASLAEGDGSGVVGDGDFDVGLSDGQTASTLTFPAGFVVENRLMRVTQSQPGVWTVSTVPIDTFPGLSGDVVSGVDGISALDEIGDGFTVGYPRNMTVDLKGRVTAVESISPDTAVHVEAVAFADLPVTPGNYRLMVIINSNNATPGGAITGAGAPGTNVLAIYNVHSGDNQWRVIGVIGA